MKDRTEITLLITIVIAAESEQQAQQACTAFATHIGGPIVKIADCSAEEPECWSVVIEAIASEHATANLSASLSGVVRRFIRTLGDEFPAPLISCEPPTAWTVLDDPKLLTTLAPGAERLLVEAWCGEDPYRMGAEHHTATPASSY